MENTSEGVLIGVRELVEAWCDRRCLIALRYALQGYPLHDELTDGWASLLDALQTVRAFAREDLTDDEKATVEVMIAEVSKVVYR